MKTSLFKERLAELGITEQKPLSSYIGKEEDFVVLLKRHSNNPGSLQDTAKLCLVVFYLIKTLTPNKPTRKKKKDSYRTYVVSPSAGFLIPGINIPKSFLDHVAANLRVFSTPHLKLLPEKKKVLLPVEKPSILTVPWYIQLKIAVRIKSLV